MTESLTHPEYWEECHRRLAGRRCFPDPRRYLGDCELDHLFRKHLTGGRCRSILEIGCGSSYWLPYFARELGLEAAGLDYSEDGVAAARSILERHGLVAELIRNDLFRQAELARPRVDAAVSLGFLEHFADPLPALEAIRRFVNPGGAVFTLVPNVPGGILRLSQRLNPGLADTYNAFDLAAWIDLHRRAGLEVVAGRYAAFGDWSWLNLSRFKPWQRAWLSRLFRLLTVPQIVLGRLFGFFVSSRTWGATIVVVARKAAAPCPERA